MPSFSTWELALLTSFVYYAMLFPSIPAAAVDDIFTCVLPTLLCLSERRVKGEPLDAPQPDSGNRGGTYRQPPGTPISMTPESVFVCRPIRKSRGRKGTSGTK